MSVRVTIHLDSAAMEDKIQRAMLLAGEHILEESNRIVPLEYGDLQRSGHVDQDGDKTQVSYSTPYAVVQHENLSYNHAPGRSAKYLEKAANGAGPAIEAIFQREMGSA